MSENLGRWTWEHDTLAAAMFMETSMRSVKGTTYEPICCCLTQSSLAWSVGFKTSLASTISLPYTNYSSHRGGSLGGLSTSNSLEIHG